MDELITEIEEHTSVMMERIMVSSYEELVDFVQQRGQYISQITNFSADQLTMEQRARLQNVLKHDGAILYRMSFYKDEAANWLKNRSDAKVHRNAYEAKYTPDSILMDRRN